MRAMVRPNQIVAIDFLGTLLSFKVCVLTDLAPTYELPINIVTLTIELRVSPENPLTKNRRSKRIGRAIHMNRELTDFFGYTAVIASRHILGTSPKPTKKKWGN